MEEKCIYSEDNKGCNCILHCEKKTTNKSNYKIDLFWETLRMYIERTYDNTNKTCILENIVFPKFEKGLNFNYPINIQEDNQIKICGIRFVSEIIVTFKNCVFLDKIDLKELGFEKDLTFDNCIFKKEIIFPDLYYNSISFINDCNFSTNNIELSNKVFESSLFFKDCKDIGKINLSNSTIKGFASFKNSDIKKTNFEKASFKDISIFIGVTFHSNVNFEYTEFNKRVYFQNVTLKGKLNLETAIFKDEVNFLGIKKKDDKELVLDNIENRETARIIKHSFEKLDNIIEANKFYALEMEKREEELLKEKDWMELIIFKFHKTSSNHSQDWMLVLFWIFIIGFLSSYLDFNLMQNEKGKHIHFSLLSISKTFCLISIVFLIDNLCKVKEKNQIRIYYLISFYLIYIYSTNDYILSLFSKTINPFSIMYADDIINGFQLIFKIIISYLIYQLIISIRQNTRRK